jgi:ElaB/YqjD/DUF883 family membrane-anchored ribosome-binding protein
MNLSNAPSVSQLPQRENNAGDQQRISDLRRELETLAQSVADVAAKRLSDIENAASQGVSLVRTEIQHRPWTSMAVASAAGGLLALAILPSSSKRHVRSSFDPRHYAESARRAISNIDTQPISSRFERMMDSVSNLDPTVITNSPAYDVVKNLVQSISNGITKK